MPRRIVARTVFRDQFWRSGLRCKGFELLRLSLAYTGSFSLRVQVPSYHILTQSLYYNYYYPKPKYVIIGYMDPKP